MIDDLVGNLMILDESNDLYSPSTDQAKEWTGLIDLAD